MTSLLVEPPVAPPPQSSQHDLLVCQLDSAEAVLQAVAQRLAHDLRTPLRHVISYAGLLQSADAVTPDRLQKVVVAAQRLQQGLDELSALTRVSQSQLQCQPVDMAALARSAWADLGAAEPVALQVLGPLPVVHGDVDLLRLVWQRLLQALRQVAVTAGGSGWVEVSGCAVPDGCAFELHWVTGATDGPAAHSQSVAADEVCAQDRALVRRILGVHGGRCWPMVAQDRPGFGFSLPAVVS
jgi:hypothetical protein